MSPSFPKSLGQRHFFQSKSQTLDSAGAIARLQLLIRLPRWHGARAGTIASMNLVKRIYAYVRVELGDVSRITLLGGAPEGRDELHQLVATWAGWKRDGRRTKMPSGDACSAYRARLWPATAMPLLHTEQIVLNWVDPTHLDMIRRVVAQTAAAKLELDPPPSHHAPLEWPDEHARAPMPHQVQAIRALQAMRFRAILADDMGLGKSGTSIYTWQQSGSPRALIVCPKTVKRNWHRELLAALRDVDVFVVDGTAKQRASVLGFADHWAQHGGDACRAAVVIHYDVLHRLPDREAEILARWVSEQFLILDESQYVKARKALRTRWIMQHLAPPEGGARCRLCLSGTPIRNTLEDLWSQVQIIRPGTWGSFAEFDKLHLVRSEMEVESRPGRKIKIHPVRNSRNREQLNAIVNTLQVRRKKEEVLDLPPKVFTYPEFELDPTTRKIYRTMKELALIELAELGDETPIFAPGANSALEATLRLEQIAQGFLGGIPDAYLEAVTPHLKQAVKIPGRAGHVVWPHSTKIEWLRETIDTVLGQEGRAVVFSRFNSILFWLVDQWPDAAILHGGMTTQQRDKVIDCFQAGGISVLFCQVKIAEGFNLTRGQDVILYGRDWSPAINAQAVDRCHRIGQTGTVNVQIPIVVGTFEQYLHRKLRAKEADAAQALKSMTVGELRGAL